MKKLIISTFILFMIFPVIAQQDESLPFVDSLEKLISNSSDPYLLIKTNAKLCWIQRSRKPADAIEYGNQALNLINQNPEYDSLRAEIFNYLGVVHRNKGNYSAAMSYYFDALEFAEKYSNMKQIAYSNNNLGGIFTLKADYINAINYMEKALSSFKFLKDTSGMGYVCVNLGNLYRHNYEYEEAINYFRNAITYKRKVNDSIGIAIATNLEAISHFENENFGEAARLYGKLQILYDHNHDFKGLAEVKNYLGLIELKNGNYTSALNYFNESYSINKSLAYKQGQSIALLNIGFCYHKLDKRKECFAKLNSGYELAKQIGDVNSLIKAYEYFALVYNDNKDFENAYLYQVSYTNEIVKKYDHEARERMNSLRINNEINKTDELNQVLISKNEKLENEIIRSSNTLWVYKVIIAVLVILLLLFTYRILHLYKKNRNKLNHNEELLKANEELLEANNLREKFLSIIGHDLKNPFNSVLGLTSLLVEEWDGIPENEKKYIINEVNGTGNTLYELMDNLLLWAKNQNHALEAHKENFNLNETIIDVYELFRNQASFKEIKLQLEIGEKNIVFADPNMINTVIRNLLSNAIKFTRKGGKILIEVKHKTNELEFSITDNGKGILPEDLKRILDEKTNHSTKGTANETGTGLGLLLVKDFVSQNNGIFWVDSKPGVGSQFCFTLPSSE